MAEDEKQILTNLAKLTAAPVEKLIIPTIGDLPDAPIVWVIDRFHAYGTLSMITGNKGSYKSLLALHAGNAVAKAPKGDYTNRSLGWEIARDNVIEPTADRPELFSQQVVTKLHRMWTQTFLGRPVLYGSPVLYIDRENFENLIGVRRKEAGIIGNKDFYYWTDSHLGAQTPTPDDPADARLVRWVRDNNALVIVDSFQDWYGSRKEIDNADMLELMGRFRILAHAGAGVILLHHLDKAGVGARGCTAITNTPDMVMRVDKNPDDPSLAKITEDGFRCCGKWQIDFRVNWNAGELLGVRHRRLELITDMDGADLAELSKNKKQAKATAKEDKEQEAAEKLLPMIKDGDSPRQIREKARMGVPRIENLAKVLGYSWDGKNWHGPQQVEGGIY